MKSIDDSANCQISLCKILIDKIFLAQRSNDRLVIFKFSEHILAFR